jgi:hypothetical protein
MTMIIGTTTLDGSSTFQGTTETSSETETCTDSCKAIGTINADYTLITLIPDDGGKIVLEKK